MPGDQRNLEQLLTRLETLGLDALAPTEVAALEAAADDPRVAARLGGLPTPARGFAAAPSPSPRQWAGAWSAIEFARARRPAAARSSRAPDAGLRLWQGFAAVAACVLLAAMWRETLLSPARGWGVQLSTNSQIESIESLGDETAYVAALGDESGSVMIWFLEGDS